MLREQWRLATKEKKEEERGGRTDLWWPLWRLMVVLAGGSDADGGSRWRSFSLLSTTSLHFFSFLHLFFYSFFVLVFCSFPLFFFFFLQLSSPIFRGKIGERKVGAAIVQPPQKPPEGHIPSVFFHTVIGHGSELRQVGALGRRLFEF